MSKVAIIGYGKVGRAYHKMFPDAVIYDPYYCPDPEGYRRAAIKSASVGAEPPIQFPYSSKERVNQCDLAIVCVPTDLVTKEEPFKDSRNPYPSPIIIESNQLDMSIVEEVVGWLETPLILIKSALQPGTVDRLVKETGKKIAVSVEMVGEGKYFVPFWKHPDSEDPTKHSFLIVGAEEETARRCADILWSKMSPDIDIHLVSAIEAEVCKLMENFWGGMKVTFANMMYDICEDLGANYTKVLQAWGADGRTEKMHMRVIPGKRGWNSKCYNKDLPALASLDKSGLGKAVLEANEYHLKR